MLSENQVLPEIVALQLGLQTPLPGLQALDYHTEPLHFQIPSLIQLAGPDNSKFDPPAFLPLYYNLIPYRISYAQALRAFWPDANKRRMVKAHQLPPLARKLFWIKVFIFKFIERLFPKNSAVKNLRERYE